MKFNEPNMTTTKTPHWLYQMLIHNGPTKEAIATGGQLLLSSDTETMETETEVRRVGDGLQDVQETKTGRR